MYWQSPANKDSDAQHRRRESHGRVDGMIPGPSSHSSSSPLLPGAAITLALWEALIGAPEGVPLADFLRSLNAPQEYVVGSRRRFSRMVREEL